MSRGFAGGALSVWEKPVWWDEPYELVEEEPLDLPPGPCTRTISTIRRPGMATHPRSGSSGC
jgi:hypothetical protein